MIILGFALAGILVTVATELLGLTHVTKYDVSRRIKTVRAWRRSQALGIAYLPLVLGFLFVGMMFTDDAFLDSLSSGTLWAYLFGVSVFIAALSWGRLIAFFAFPRHWQEAAMIIASRCHADSLGS